MFGITRVSVIVFVSYASLYLILSDLPDCPVCFSGQLVHFIRYIAFLMYYLYVYRVVIYFVRYFLLKCNFYVCIFKKS
jgi:hypothetical protein